MKQNKIIVAVSPDDKARRLIIQRLLVRLKFAVTPCGRRQVNPAECA